MQKESNTSHTSKVDNLSKSLVHNQSTVETSSSLYVDTGSRKIGDKVIFIIVLLSCDFLKIEK